VQSVWAYMHKYFLVLPLVLKRFFWANRTAPEGEDIDADLSLAGLCSKLLEEDVLGHSQPVLAVGIVQRGVIPLGDLAHPHIGHRGLEEQQLAANGFHHEIGSLKGRSHCTVWLQQRRLQSVRADNMGIWPHAHWAKRFGRAAACQLLLL